MNASLILLVDIHSSISSMGLHTVELGIEELVHLSKSSWKKVNLGAK